MRSTSASATEPAKPSLTTVFAAGAEGKEALIPVMHDFNSTPTMVRVPGFRAFASHANGVLTFRVIVPKDRGYSPVASEKRDLAQWNEDAVELFLRPAGGKLHQFIVNSIGAILDVRDGDAKWDSQLKTSVAMKDDAWEVTLALPLADLGASEAVLAQPLDFILAVRTRLGGDSTILTAAPAVPPNFASPQNFGKLLLVKPGVAVVNSLRVDSVLRKGKVFALFAATLSDGTEAAKEFPMADADGTFVFEPAPDFIFPVRLANAFTPEIEIKRREGGVFSLTVKRPERITQLADTMRLSLDGKPLTDRIPVAWETKLPLSPADLKPGRHEAVLELFQGGKPLPETAKLSFTSIDESPLPFDLETIDVSAVFPAVKEEFPRIAAARSNFQIGEGGLPASIEVAGHALLAGPARFLVAGEPVAVPVAKTSAHRNAVAWAGESPALKVAARTEFDGFTWIDADLATAQKAEVVIPLQFPMKSDIFLNQSKTGWSAPLAEGLTTVERMAYVQISDGIRGMDLYFPPSAAGLNLENYGEMLRIERTGSKVTLRLRVSDAAMSPADGRVRFGFGLQPFPFRTYDNNANFQYRIARTCGYDFLKSVRPELLAGYAKAGTRFLVHHEWWNTLQSYFTILEQQDRFRALLADVHASGMKYIPYFGFQISEKAPEYPVYFPFIGTGTADVPYIAPNVPPARAFNVDYTSIWGDHWLRGIGQFVKDYPVDGMYMDGTLSIGEISKDDGRFPLKDSRGRKQPYFPTLEKRRFAILLHQQTRGARPNLVWDFHCSHSLPGATASLATLTWNGEQMWQFVEGWKMPVDVYRAQFNGRLYGIPIQLLSNSWMTNLERDLGITLLFDSLPRPMEGLEHPGALAAFKAWRIFDEQNLRGEFFTPFFDPKARYRDTGGRALISAYEQPGHTVLVVSNYENTTATTARIDLRGTPCESATTARDVWHDESFPVENGTLTIPLAPETFRLLRLEIGD